jgi:flagellar basal-body rod modification protein FlgD
MSLASVSSQQTANTSTSASASNPLASLTGNFTSFLNLLMTQLQNQDPTSPLDSSQFTTELVQFSGVEQQISTNSSLQQMIALSQAGQVMQSAAIIGHQVAVQSNQMPLQNGTGGLQITPTQAGPVTITISNTAGAEVRTATVSATTGTSNWAWDGTDDSGNTLPNGNYNVTVTQGTTSTGSAVPFGVVGTATAVQNQNGTLNLQLGTLSVAFSTVQSLVN